MPLTAEINPQNTQPCALTLNVALLGNDLQSHVPRGENAERKLRHDFVSLNLAKVGMAAAVNRSIGSGILPGEFGGDKATALAAWATQNATPVQATGDWLNPVADGGDASNRTGIQ